MPRSLEGPGWHKSQARLREEILHDACDSIDHDKSTVDRPRFALILLESNDSWSFPGFECLRQHRLSLRGLLKQQFRDAIVVEQQRKVEPVERLHQVEIAR